MKCMVLDMYFANLVNWYIDAKSLNKHMQFLLKIYVLRTHTLRFSIFMNLLLDFELQEVTPTCPNKGG